MSATDQVNSPMDPGPFLEADWKSIEVAIRQEIDASRQALKSSWLEIDAIEQLPAAPGHYVYRLLLSTPVYLSPEQPIRFRTRKPSEDIPATVIQSDDEGIVVECDEPLPTDARLLNIGFDPAFILRALQEFLSELLPTAGGIFHLIAGRRLPQLPEISPRKRPGLNEDQCRAIEEMSLIPVHLLWGPPGTGKTTTLGAAVVEWLRQQKSVLIVSTSNAAVDVAMRAVLSRINPEEMKSLLRLGTSLDSQVAEITLAGKMSAEKVALAQEVISAQERLSQIVQLLSTRDLPQERRRSLEEVARALEEQISSFNQQARESGPEMISSLPVIGCTLAKMVLDQAIRKRRFDTVVLDEVSMASLVYVFAASMLARSHLVCAGDPKQLPPIVQSTGADAVKWFSRNIYDWLRVGLQDEAAAAELSLLRNQYRMTNQIGGVVSRLSYHDLLEHGRRVDGPPIQFIDMPFEWQTTYYSVREESYYHFAAVPLLHALIRKLREEEFLFVSPFRPQRSLLSALSFDLAPPLPKSKMSASTIHRAQGSEAKCVIVDLTTHSPQQPVAFFRDRNSSKLFNVAISRAKDRLIILGSRALLRALALGMRFWERVIDEFGNGIEIIPAKEHLEELPQYESLTHVGIEDGREFPAIYSHSTLDCSPEPMIDILQRLPSNRKLLVLPDRRRSVLEGNIIQRTSTSCPPVFVAAGYVCLPWRDRWIVVNSPNASRVIWRVGFSHLADEEVDPLKTSRFFCPRCATGDLMLRRFRGEGWFLCCHDNQNRQCSYRRPLSLSDAKLKVRIQGCQCPSDHPMTVRNGKKGFFLSCENYPACKYAASLSLFEGI